MLRIESWHDILTHQPTKAMMETLFEPATLPNDLNEDPRVRAARRNAEEALEALYAIQETRKTAAASIPALEAAVQAAHVAEALGEASDKGAAERLATTRAAHASAVDREPVQLQVVQEYNRRLNAAYDEAARDVQAHASSEAERLQQEHLAAILAAAQSAGRLNDLYRWRLRFSAVTERPMQLRRPIVIMHDLLPNGTDIINGTSLGRFIRSLESAGIDPGDLKPYR